MADVTLTVQDSTRAIATCPNVTDDATAATSSDTYYFANDGRVVLIVDAATTATVTIETPGSVAGNAIADTAVALPDGDTYVLGPFPTSVYNDSQGRVKVTVSANTTIMALRV
ncbi:MAG: hypothetical protein KBA95_18560 [Acidobacteria bacterium]|nr:hypothetical protein [Acidobacteriota bacterium]